MRFDFYDGKLNESTFHDRTIHGAMDQIARFMVKESIERGEVFQVIKGVHTGKGWIVRNVNGTMCYQVKNSFRTRTTIGKVAELC